MLYVNCRPVVIPKSEIGMTFGEYYVKNDAVKRSVETFRPKRYHMSHLEIMAIVKAKGIVKYPDWRKPK